MPDDLPFVPHATLDVVDAGWWLDLCCACGRSTSIPHRPLAKRPVCMRGCRTFWSGCGARSPFVRAVRAFLTRRTWG